jgi:Zn-dependent protease with chaperone function
MIDGPVFLLKIATLWLLVTLVASWMCALAYPLFARLLAPCAPSARAACCFAFGLMPPLAAGLVVFLLLNPELAGLLVPDHCHAGVCGAHKPVYAASALTLSLVAAGSFTFIGVVAFLLVGARRTGRHMMALLALARPVQQQGYQVLDSDGLLAWCGGLWRPQILLSRGLVERLSEQQLQAVLAHERAHAERFDNLRAFLLYWATLAWPARQRSAIRAELALGSEQACDRIAAERVGSRELVATALAALERNDRMPAGSMAFGGRDTQLRLSALGAEPLAFAHSGRAWLALALQWTFMVLVLTGISHVVIEWVAGIAR